MPLCCQKAKEFHDSQSVPLTLLVSDESRELPNVQAKTPKLPFGEASPESRRMAASGTRAGVRRSWTRSLRVGTTLPESDFWHC